MKSQVAIVVSLIFSFISASSAVAVDFVQEFPSTSVIDTLNGARLFRGWKCDHGTISRAVDGGQPVQIASKLSRNDTIPPACESCCDNDGSNGYAELINVPLLGEGRHTIEFFDDGAKFAEAEFDVIKVRDDNFLRGSDVADAQTEFFLPGFPGPNEGVYVKWFQGEQGFFATGYCSDAPGGTPCAQDVFFEDWEDGLGFWSVSNGFWQVGAPGSGPDGCGAGTQCAATLLDGGVPIGANSRLLSPTIQLPALGGGEELQLRFLEWIQNEQAIGTVQIQVFDGVSETFGGFQNLSPVSTGYSESWTEKAIDLTAFSGEKVRVGFNIFRAGGVSGIQGWFIDNVRIVEVPVF